MPRQTKSQSPVDTVNDLVASINQRFGPNTVFFGDDPSLKVEYLSIGVAPFDDLLSGGLPRGRFVELYGPYSSLKTYIGLCAIAQAQKRGEMTALIDTENSFDPEWAEKIGVDTSKLLYRHPENGEKAIDLVEILLRSGQLSLIVFDSVAAALPQSEQKKSMVDNIQPARQADMMSKAMRKLTAANSRTAVLWINQTRINVGIMFGNPETTTGGRALGFYASYRIEMHNAGKVSEEVVVHVPDNDGKPVKRKIKKIIGMQVRANLTKSKLSSPHKEVSFVYSMNDGVIDEWLYLLHRGLDEGIVGYDRGKWWLSDLPAEKCSQSQFRGKVSLDQLQRMLSPTPKSAGVPGPARKRAAMQRRASSDGSARGSTPTAGRAASSSTVRIKRR